jgi:putative membrane protein
MKKPLATSIALLALFVVTAVVSGNNEFLFYAGTLVFLVGALFAVDRYFAFSGVALWGFNLWLLMHLLGGMGSINGTRLYDVILWPLVGAPYDILRYDQLVHVFCYTVIAMLVWEALSRPLAGGNRAALMVLTVLAAAGIGSLNEVIEFAAVVIVGSTGVGDYTNTALDLVANLLGAMIGASCKAFAIRTP